MSDVVSNYNNNSKKINFYRYFLALLFEENALSNLLLPVRYSAVLCGRLLAKNKHQDLFSLMLLLIKFCRYNISPFHPAAFPEPFAFFPALALSSQKQ